MLRRVQPAVISHDRRLRFRRAIQILSPAHVLRHGFELRGYRHRHVCAPTKGVMMCRKVVPQCSLADLRSRQTHSAEPAHRSAIPGSLPNMHHYSDNSVSKDVPRAEGDAEITGSKDTIRSRIGKK